MATCRLFRKSISRHPPPVPRHILVPGYCTSSPVKSEERTYTKTTTPFSYLQIAKEYVSGDAKDRNFVFSPCSIQLGLSLIANGSTGSTRKELLHFLQAKDMNDLNSSNGHLLESFGYRRTGYPLIFFAGGVWVDHSFPLRSSFQENIAKLYGGEAKNIDFKDPVTSKEGIEKMNEWAKKTSKGCVESILQKNSFDPLRRLVLASALFFRAKWAPLRKFSKCDTKMSKFYLPDGSFVEVPFMSSRKDQSISVFDDFKVANLPYLNKLSMYIILPNERDGLWALAERVGTDPLFLEKYVLPNEKLVKVGEFMVPKFKFSYDLEASAILKGMGLNTCFSREAEFDEMVQELKHDDWLQVSNIYHNSRIEVNEEGTEAATVKALNLRGCAPPKCTPPVDFVADRPFMFLVRDDKRGTVLFMGHVINPLLQ